MQAPDYEPRVAPSGLQRVLDAISTAMLPLALAITALLFAQWPLRDGIGRGSIQANDLAQWLFALYVAVAINHTHHRGAHLVARPDLAQARHGRLARLRRIGAPMCVLPWALFLVVSAWAPVRNSVLSLEPFPESLNPGYFMIQIALMLMGVLMTVQSALDLWNAFRHQPAPEGDA